LGGGGGQREDLLDIDSANKFVFIVKGDDEKERKTERKKARIHSIYQEPFIIKRLYMSIDDGLYLYLVILR